MPRMPERPRVGISRCLLGDEVRYDGTHTLDADLVSTLGAHVEWVPVCPEVEVGMGTPREPIHLVAGANGVPSADARVRLLGVTSGTDWTGRMHAWARTRAEALRQLGLSGFILKARSPSCGIRDVRVDGDERSGRGLFAQAIVDAMPGLPVADEDELHDPAARRAFLTRVLAFRRGP
ncbi:MAG: DUF523 domain-containing protein [Acidimicrobiia bacterium]|nr:DUF523 domain-containing protein [Acidimicrobiia bacterium]